MNSREYSLLKGSLLAGASLAAIWSAPGFAEEARPAAAAAPASDKSSVAEVTVTARRREERLLDVPVAASALSQKALARYSIADLSTIGAQIPNVNISQGGVGAGATLSIRGIGSSSADTSTDSAVTIDVDGVSIDRGRGIPSGIFDLGNVVVLKGPQSLYFGKNSPAGVVALSSQNPGNQFEGYAKVGYETEAEEAYIEAAAGGPVSDNLKIRLAFRGSDMFGGWVKDVAVAQPDPFHPGETLPGAPHNEAPQQKKAALRFTAIWQPTDRFDATLKVLGMHYRDNGAAGLVETERCAPGVPGAIVLGVLDPNSGCTADYQNDHGANPPQRIAAWPHASTNPYSEIDGVISGLTLNYRTPLVAFTSVTGLYYYNESNFDMSAPDVFAQYGGYDGEVFTSWSQEFRARTLFKGPLNFAGGVYLQTKSMTVRTSDAIFDAVPLGVGPDPRNGQLNNWQDYDKDTGHTESFYVEGTYDLLPNLELDGGVRYTHEVKNGDIGTTFVNQTFAHVFNMSPEGVRIRGGVTADNWSPQVTLTWHPSSNITLYGAYKTGFKSGGFGNPTVIPGGSTAAQYEYKPEIASGGEIGAKGRFLDGRLTGDITLYDYEYSNLQVTQFDQATISFLIENAAKARARGVEAQANWQVTDNLSLRGNVAYNEAQYLSYPGAPCYSSQTAAQGCNVSAGTQDLGGTTRPNSPKWDGSVGMTYTHPITQDLSAVLGGDLRYTSSYTLGQGALLIQPASTRLDLSLRVSSLAGGWDVAVIAKNATNEKQLLTAVAAPLGAPGQLIGPLARPRQIYIELTKRF